MATANGGSGRIRPARSARCRRALRAACKCGAGQVARATFSGPRSRGTVFGSQALRHQHGFFLRSSQLPRMGPAPGPRAICPGTRAACQGVARHRRRRRAAVVPPGAGLIRGRLPRLQGTAVTMRLRGSPASVRRRTGAPPPPFRRDVGRLNARGQTALGSGHCRCRTADELMVVANDPGQGRYLVKVCCTAPQHGQRSKVLGG